MSMFTISPAAETNPFWWHRRSSLTLSSKSFSSLAVIVFLDGTVNSGSTNSISSKTLSFYKADQKHIFSDHFSDVGRGLLCPSSIRLRCPGHETSHWLLLTCGWTSWVLHSQMIVHCSGWPMISKPRTAEFALQFYQRISKHNSYLTLSKVFVNTNLVLHPPSATVHICLITQGHPLPTNLYSDKYSTNIQLLFPSSFFIVHIQANSVKCQ